MGERRKKQGNKIKIGLGKVRINETWRFWSNIEKRTGIKEGGLGEMRGERSKEVEKNFVLAKKGIRSLRKMRTGVQRK